MDPSAANTQAVTSTVRQGADYEKPCKPPQVSVTPLKQRGRGLLKDCGNKGHQIWIFLILN